MSFWSLSLSMALSPLARISPWLRWEPKMMSFTPSVNAWPTAEASWPTDRWAGPGWSCLMPLYSPVVLIRLSMVSNSLMIIMSRQMRIRASFPWRFTSSSNGVWYWFTGMSVKAIFPFFRTFFGSIICDFGMDRFSFNSFIGNPIHCLLITVQSAR